MSRYHSCFITSITLLTIFLTGCSSSQPQPTKGSAYPQMYQEKPRSILILPPINESTDTEAKDYYMTTTEVPFALMGYYVFPTEMVADILNQEGIYDASILQNMPATKFYEYFGADAVLFTTIHKWDVSYTVVASTLHVAISAKLVSTKTNKVLWEHSKSVTVDLGSANTNSLEGLLISVVLTAINTASADYVEYAKVVNDKLIYTLPAGPYSPMYLKDEDMPLRQY